jgi:hypothetical protein
MCLQLEDISVKQADKYPQFVVKKLTSAKSQEYIYSRINNKIYTNAICLIRYIVTDAKLL